MIEIIARDIDDNAIAGVVQWDRDVRIYLSDKGISQPYQVHMFNNFSKEALVVDTEFKDGRLCAKIPNDLLIQPLPIIGFVNVTENDEARCTYCFKINMRKKPKPSDYVHKDSNDYVSVGEIRDECKKYAEEATKAAEQASENASKAEESAHSAEQSKKDAETEADRSEKAADRAETAAQQAESAKINVVQTTGESTTDVMSQKAVTDALNEHKGVNVVQITGESTEDVMSQKAVTNELNNLDKKIEDSKVNVVKSTGASEMDVMSQKAVTDKFEELDNKVEEYKVNVVQTRGESTEDVMSQNAVTEELVKLEEADVGRKSSFDATSEIFNSYEGEDANQAGTELEEEQTPFYAHAEGYGNSALAKGSHAEGHGNTIENGCDNSHAEGDGNSITQGSTNSHVGGKGNQVQGQSDNTIVYGLENTVIASDNAIVAGQHNAVTNSGQSLIAGQYNEVTGTIYNANCDIYGFSANLVAAANSKIQGSEISGLIGNLLTATNSKGCLLIGQTVSVINGKYSLFVGNSTNFIEGSPHSDGGSVIAGNQHVMEGGHYYCLLVSGGGHRVNGDTSRCYIGGHYNTVANIIDSLIFGGYNTVTSSTSDQMYYINVLGDSNNVTDTRYSFVAGENNEVHGGTSLNTDVYVIGYTNTLNGTSQSAVIGSNNTANGAQDGHIFGYENEILSANHGNAIGDWNTIHGGQRVYEFGLECEMSGSQDSATVGEYNIINGGSYTNSFGHHLKQEGATSQVAVGQFNKNDYESGYIFVVGCGTSEDDRKNAIEVSNTEVIINNDVTINGELKGYAKKEDIANIAGNSTFVSVSYVDGAINVTEDSGVNVVTKSFADEEAFILYDGTNRNKGYTAHFTWTNAEHSKNAEIIGFVRPTGTVVVFNGVISELGSDIVLYADDGKEIGTISIDEDRVLSLNFTGDRTSLKMEGYITTFRQG